MRLLKKSEDDALSFHGLNYDDHSDKIHAILLAKQFGFCAYTEILFEETSSKDIEHFCPSLKKTDDGFWNWYLVSHWVNNKRPRKFNKRFYPMASPSDWTIAERITYVEIEWLEEKRIVCTPKDPNDKEIQNLLDFLGVMKDEIAIDRFRHIDILRDLWVSCGEDKDFFIEQLFRHPFKRLSYFTTIEQLFGIELFDKIRDWSQQRQNKKAD